MARQDSKETTPDLFEEFGIAQDAEDVAITSDKIAEAFLEAVGMDGGEPEPNDPNFWEKHDKKHHHGHFDPETQRCSLREEVEADEEAKDKGDDIGSEQPNVAGLEAPEKRGAEEEKDTDWEKVDAEYMDAVKRGDMEKCAEMVLAAAAKAFPKTKIVDKKGLPKIVFKGQDKTRNVYDMTQHEGGSSWFSEDEGHAGEYGKIVSPFFLNAENLLDFSQVNQGTELFDTNGDGASGYLPKDPESEGYVKINQDWWACPWTVKIAAQLGIPLEDFFRKTVDVGDTSFLDGNSVMEVTDQTWFNDALRNAGYDAVKTDESVFTYGVARGDIIKSAEPVTYDDKGNVIPLSKRFQGNNPDIRFSKEGGATSAWDAKTRAEAEAAKEILEKCLYGTTVDFAEHEYQGDGEEESRASVVSPELDAEYMDAVERGDLEKCAELVKEAASIAGYDIHSYHGTELTFLGLDKPFTQFEEASHFGKREVAEKVAQSRGNGNAAEQEPYVYDVFLKIENPKSVSDVPEDWNDTHSEYWWAEIAKAKAEGYDGLIYKNQHEDKKWNKNSYVPISPDQIKSADPVVYDDEGNVIPLSRRFDQDSDDIRYAKTGSGYSLGAPYQGSKGRIASQIIDLLPEGSRFVDLFSGGGAMTHAAMLSGKFDSYRMNDISPKGQDLFLQGIRGEWNDYKRVGMTKESFEGVKGTPEGIIWSFNNKGNEFAGGEEGLKHARRNIERMKRLGELSDKADKVNASNLDYRQVEIRPGDVLYADIPYEGTNRRGYGSGSFDKEAFIKWAEGLEQPVFVSEYQMPDGWTEIGSWNVSGIRGRNPEEKLFVQDRFANRFLNGREQRYFRNGEGKVVGTYDRASGKITLYPGAKAKDVVHEFSHGLWQFAEQEAAAGRSTLMTKFRTIADSAPQAVKDAVKANYGTDNPNVYLEECFTHEMARQSEGNSAFARAIETPEGRPWYRRAWGVIKNTWNRFAAFKKLANVDVSKMDRMDAAQSAKFILRQLAKGAHFGTVQHTGEGTRKSIIGEKGAANLGIGRRDEAERMAQSGASRKDIWQKTGWWKGKDGRWRVEAPDVKLPFSQLPSNNIAANARYRAEQVLSQVGGNKIDDLKKLAPQEYQKWEDEMAKAQEAAQKEAEGKFKIRDFVTGTKIEKAYPSLMDTPVIFTDLDNWGEWRGNKMVIKRSLRPSDLRSVIAHEFQHAIQDIEDFSRGANPKNIADARDGVNDIEKLIIATIKENGYSKWSDEVALSGLTYDTYLLGKQKYPESRFPLQRMFAESLPEKEKNEVMNIIDFGDRSITEWDKGRDLPGETPFEAHRAAGGEVEARNVQQRLSMTPEERATIAPWTTEDVPEAKQSVVRRGLPDQKRHENTNISAAAVNPPDLFAEFGVAKDEAIGDSAPDLFKEYGINDGII